MARVGDRGGDASPLTLDKPSVLDKRARESLSRTEELDFVRVGV